MSRTDIDLHENDEEVVDSIPSDVHGFHNHPWWWYPHIEEHMKLYHHHEHYPNDEHCHHHHHPYPPIGYPLGHHFHPDGPCEPFHECEPAYHYHVHKNIIFSKFPPRDLQAFWLRYIDGDYSLWVLDMPTKNWVKVYGQAFDAITEALKKQEELNTIIDNYEEELKKLEEKHDKDIEDIEKEISNLALPYSLEYTGKQLKLVNRKGVVLSTVEIRGIDKLRGDIMTTLTDNGDTITIKSPNFIAGNNLIRVTDTEKELYTFNAPTYEEGVGIKITQKPNKDNHKVYEISTDGSIYKFKGSVNTINDLPSNANQGDVYSVVTKGTLNGQEFEANTNFAYTGNSWDSLGGIIDYPVISASEQSATQASKVVVNIAIQGEDSHQIHFDTLSISDLMKHLNCKVTGPSTATEGGTAKVQFYYGEQMLQDCFFNIKTE